ncbi:MAG: hypothetical protein R2688_09250 [Fimbriimonadaceae bacterium]
MSENPIVTKFKDSGWEVAMDRVGNPQFGGADEALNALIIHHRKNSKDLHAIINLTEIAETKIIESTDEEALSGFKAICFNPVPHFLARLGDDDVEITPEAEASAAPYAMKNLEPSDSTQETTTSP